MKTNRCKKLNGGTVIDYQIIVDLAGAPMGN